VAAFSDLDWRRIDVTAIVTFGGLATIDERRHPACRDWLAQLGYEFAAARAASRGAEGASGA
jgi:hypothetical protein